MSGFENQNKNMRLDCWYFILQYWNIMNSFPPYRMISVIGKGVFGYVFLGENKNTKESVAIKRTVRVSREYLSRQYQILKQIQQCQYVIKLHEFFCSLKNDGSLVQNMVFQYIEDSLQNIIQRHKKAKTRIPEKDIKNYLYQLLKGLQYIHAKKIAHRDLKPENLLVTKKGALKICDFGSAKILNPNGSNTPYIVSRYYRAPQLVLSITKYGTQIDIWSVGCIMAELFLLKPIFKGTSEADQVFKILQIMGQYEKSQMQYLKQLVTYDSGILDQLNGYYKQNLDQIFNMVDDRKNFIDLFEKMLCFHPKRRIKAKDALMHPFFSECRKLQKNKTNPKMQSEQETSISPSKLKKK